MAARTLRPRHQDDIRQKIQASQLVNRLQDDALGKIELTQGQRKSIEILLRKSIADLSSIELKNPDGESFRVVASELTDDQLANIAGTK